MATFVESTKKKLRALAGTSKISDTDEGLATLAADVETKCVIFSQGLYAARPAEPYANALYWATDLGVLLRGNGSEWIVVWLGTQAVSTLTVGGAQTDKSIYVNGTDYTPNPARPTWVCAWGNTGGSFPNQDVAAYVNGRQILARGTSNGTTPFGFLVPAGYRFSMQAHEGLFPPSGFASYTTL